MRAGTSSDEAAHLRAEFVYYNAKPADHVHALHQEWGSIHDFSRIAHPISSDNFLEGQKSAANVTIWNTVLRSPISCLVMTASLSLIIYLNENFTSSSTRPSDIPSSADMSHPTPADAATPATAAAAGAVRADTTPASPRTAPTHAAVSVAVTTPSLDLSLTPPEDISATATADAAGPVPASAMASVVAPQGPAELTDPSPMPAEATPPKGRGTATHASSALSDSALSDIPSTVATPHPAPANEEAPSIATASDATKGDTAAPSPLAEASPTQPPISAVAVSELLMRGDALFGIGDIASARLFYEHGADAGDGTAALRLGESFDPGFLARARLGLFPSDLKKAAYWYRRAGDLGNGEAAILLKSLHAD